MYVDEKNWLPHLKNLPNSIDGYKTCTYLIALEGWRRGLNLQFHLQPGIAISRGIAVSLSDGKNKHFFTVSRGDKVTNEAINICVQKPTTYEYLRQNKVPVPEGRDFKESDHDTDIINYAKEIGFPLVVKPTDGASGKGVITDINSVEQLEKALQTVRGDLGYKNVIVERFIKGMDYRVYVVDDQVIGVYKRVPANVIGDGKSTIKELISIKNNIRRKNPFIKNRSIKIDDNLIENLREENLTLDSIIEKGRRVFLRKQGEYLRERDPVDITDEVSQEIKDIAIKAVKSIPGLPHCNVDMLVNEETGEGYVNEINSRPQISNHLFPLEGKARDVPKAIIDYYFPDTKDGKRSDKYYFDFEFVHSSYLKSNSSLVEIPDIPFNHKLTRFRLDGDLQKKHFERWFRREFARLKMYGYLMHLKNGQTSVVVSGTTKALERFRRSINKEFLFKSKVKSIKEYSRSRPIVLSYNVYSNRKIKSPLDKLKDENKNLEKQLQKYKKEYNLLSNSLPNRLYRKLRNIRGKSK